MAYSFVGSGTYNNDVGGTGVVNYTATAGNTFKVYSLTNAVPTGLTLSDGNNTYTLLGSVSGGGLFLGEWRAHVATGGALNISISGAGTYGLWVEEIAGLAAVSFITGSFQSQTQNGPGVGVNILTTTAAPNATSVPAMVSAFSVNVNAITVPNADAGPSLGTTFAYTSRAVGWLGSASQQAALAEDIRATSTGTVAMTFGTVSGNQFDTFLTVASADVESSGALALALSPLSFAFTLEPATFGSMASLALANLSFAYTLENATFASTANTLAAGSLSFSYAIQDTNLINTNANFEFLMAPVSFWLDIHREWSFFELDFSPLAWQLTSQPLILATFNNSPFTMPNLVGLLLQEALLVLQTAGILVPQKIGYFGTYPITVVWTTPVTTSLGFTFGTSGFGIAGFGISSAAAAGPGIVTAQSIPANTGASPNAPITLTVNQFPFGVVFPSGGGNIA